MSHPIQDYYLSPNFKKSAEKTPQKPPLFQQRIRSVEASPNFTPNSSSKLSQTKGIYRTPTNKDRIRRMPGSSPRRINEETKEERDLKIEKLIKDLDEQSLKIEKFNKDLQKFDNYSEGIDQQIDEKWTENKQLSDLIKAKELEIQGKTYAKSRELTQEIQENDKIMQNLEKQRYELRIRSKILTQNKKKNKELFQIAKENDEIFRNNMMVTKQIDDYKKHGIKKEEFLVLQDQTMELEEIQNELISQNSQLKEEIEHEEGLKAKIVEDSNIMIKNKEELYKIWNELKKIKHLVQCYQNRQPINLINLICEREINDSGLDIEDSISSILKELQSLKAIASDLYAEHCGNNCFSQ
ncbi:unnamed protein product [Blepharisma stoltei]|uniref:Uncharacterized protein n=1 Tax=Blepharisma stoltei TaxID=1481888 RepID=A0AAU9IRI1_9CILI|nr:unnamed protein product [Blepharisma stoltei]